MPVTDRREPGVYVTIEDHSFVLPTTEIGRTGYIVILADRGPHNRVVRITSHQQYQELFGVPNIKRTSQTHYYADRYIQLSSSMYIVRAVPSDALTANAIITEPTTESPPWTSDSAAVVTPDSCFYWEHGKTYVEASNPAVDITSTPVVSVGDWIFAGSDYVSIPPPGSPLHTQDSIAAQVISIDDNPLSATYGRIYLDRPYAGDCAGACPGGSGSPTISCEAIFYKYVQYDTLQDIEEVGVDPEADLLSRAEDSTTVFMFYAQGVGKWYGGADNTEPGLLLKGVRNVQQEKQFTDENGDVLYEYVFMDLALYYVNEDGDETLLEGPWTVSLIPKTAQNVLIRDLSSGAVMYIVDIINNNSKYIQIIEGAGIDKLVKDPTSGATLEEQLARAEERRLKVMLELSQTTPINTSNVAKGGVRIYGGFDGNADQDAPIPLYDEFGNIQPFNTHIQAQMLNAYRGTLQSVDGSIEQIREVTYPWYNFDYIISGDVWPATADAARDLADYRQDCIHLSDTRSQESGKEIANDYQDDLTARLEEYPWNNWTSALYVQYREITDPYSGQKVWMSPVYHALERHLITDAQYFIAEPVAGIEKGAITEPIKLAYRANHVERGDLIDAQLNPTIVEPQGKYIHHQLSTWKRLSILGRLHVGKFVAYLRRVIPTLLKDLLHRRATQYWIGQASIRCNAFLNKFLESNIERYSILKSYSVSVDFDDVRSELNVYINIVPIRAIERINVYIIVS